MTNDDDAITIRRSMRRLLCSDHRLTRAIAREVNAQSGAPRRAARFWEMAWGNAVRVHREACEQHRSVRSTRLDHLSAGRSGGGTRVTLARVHLAPLCDGDLADRYEEEIEVPRAARRIFAGSSS